MARYSISENLLTRMGNALRVHFGDYKAEGTTEFKSDIPLVFKTDNFIGFEGANPEPIEYDASPFCGKPYTFTFHGAASIKVAIVYRTGSRSGVDEYIWIAPGLHKRYDAYEPGKFLKYGYDEINLDKRYMCTNCGAVDTIVDLETKEPIRPFAQGGYKDLVNGGVTYCECTNCGMNEFLMGAIPGNHPLVEMLITDNTYEEHVFQGDTITVFPQFYDSDYSQGFYMEIRAYDENGRELKMYDLTTGKIPNSYSPEEMITAVEKLNYFPNGEEVKF